MILGLAAVGLGLHFKKPALVWAGGIWAAVSLAASIYVVSQGSGTTTILPAPFRVPSDPTGNTLR